MNRRRPEDDRPGRRRPDGSWRAPAWLIPVIFLCLLIALAVIIIVMAAGSH